MADLNKVKDTKTTSPGSWNAPKSAPATPGNVKTVSPGDTKEVKPGIGKEAK